MLPFTLLMLTGAAWISIELLRFALWFVVAVTAWLKFVVVALASITLYLRSCDRPELMFC